jgi:hypothetical protein
MPMQTLPSCYFYLDAEFFAPPSSSPCAPRVGVTDEKALVSAPQFPSSSALISHIPNSKHPAKNLPRLLPLSSYMPYSYFGAKHTYNFGTK